MSKKEKVTYLRCALPKCDNPLTGKQRKFCSRKCLIKANCLARKDVYKDLNGWAGGPRGLTTVESSIKYDETHVTGNGRFAVDDYHVDPDIFAIAEANHEQYVQDRNEHEAKVVIAGLEAFVEEYNKHHDVSYETLRSKKYLANLTEDQKVGMRNKNKKYVMENKNKINKRAKEKYRTNKEVRKKRAAYSKKYYEQNVRKPDLFRHEEWLKKRISGS
tara:strand:+ start:12073 stop:12723 length:651 start_codon:yes stop_codon:yes gene_type:complete